MQPQRVSARLPEGTTHAILLVVHDDLLEGDETVVLAPSRLVDLSEDNVVSGALAVRQSQQQRRAYPNVPSPSLPRRS